MPLALLCVAQFVAVLDVNAVLVSLPVIGRDLGLSGGGLQWVVTAYVLLFAGCLLVSGRLADSFGRRRTFSVGLVLFTAASLACGLAPAAGSLVLARAVQGLGAALTAPAALAMVVDAFPAGRPRERAIAVWTGVAALGGATGLMLGGAIAGGLGWRWIFLVNVPVGLAALALAPRVLRESRAEQRPRRLDLPGAVGATGGLALLVLALALAQAERAGPLAPATLAALAAAALLLALLVMRERSATDPLVPPALLRTRALSAALLAAALLTATTSGGGVLATLQLQDVLHMGPARAGLTLLPLSVAVVAGSLAAPRLRLSGPAVIVGGIGLVGAGSIAAATAVTGTHAAGGVVTWGLLGGLGLGVASVAATTCGATAVGEADRATAAGLLSTAAQVGTAVGVALLVLVAGTGDGAAGHRLGFGAAAALAGLGAASVAALLRQRSPRRAYAAGVSERPFVVRRAGSHSGGRAAGTGGRASGPGRG